MHAVWDGAATHTDQLGEPSAVAVDRSGVVYVTDRLQGRVLKLDPTGAMLAVWHESASGPFARPTGITADGQGQIYVSEGDGHCVRKLAPNGTELARWGEQGERWGALNAPAGVTVDQLGNVYVADSGNSRVQKLTSTGIGLSSWSYLPTPGAPADDEDDDYSADAFLSRPRDVATGLTAGGAGSTSEFLVADWGNHRIVGLDRLGRKLRTWGASTDRPGLLQRPQQVVVDREGAVHVTDSGRRAVLRYDARGRLLGEWRLPAVMEDGEEYVPAVGPLALAPSGDLYASESSGTRLYRVSPAGTVLATWDLAAESRENSIYPTALAVDSAGLIYILHGGSRVQRLSPAGERLGGWGGRGSEPGQLLRAADIALGRDGTVFVLDAGNDRVQRFDANGGLLGMFGRRGQGPGTFNNATSLDVDPAGNVLVSDGGALGRVQRFTPDGQALEGIHLGSGEANGATRLRGVCAAPNGRVFVADNGTGRVYTID